MSKRRPGNISESSINRDFALLRAVLRLAFKDGKLAKMPDIPFAAEHNERDRECSEDEYHRIVSYLAANATRPEIADIVTVLWEIGFRVGEVLRITPAALDKNQRTVDLRNVRAKHGKLFVLPMPDAVWQIVSARLKDKLRTAPLFPGIHRGHVYNAFKWACKQLEINGLIVHDLRGSFATRKDREKWSHKVIMAYTGHRREEIFHKHYLRPSIADLRAFAAKPRRIGTALAPKPLSNLLMWRKYYRMVARVLDTLSRVVEG